MQNVSVQIKVQARKFWGDLSFVTIDCSPKRARRGAAGNRGIRSPGMKRDLEYRTRPEYWELLEVTEFIADPFAVDSFVTVTALLYPAFLARNLEAPLTPSLTPIESLLFDIVLGTLAVGLPIVMVLVIRFLWDRSLNLGRSKELEKLIWQLHRIASAMESQKNLSFAAVQPGTEEPRDLAYLQQIAAQPAAGKAAVATASASAADPAPAAQPQSLPALERREPSAEDPRAGVNSMFGL
jgi:hypothetical protein